jgi:hypothetical protein
MKLKKMFNYINQELFDNMLDTPLLHVLSNKESRKLWTIPIDGICIPFYPEGYAIGIHEDLTDTEAFDTMTHEMIHMHLMEKNKYSGHGKPFKKMCRKAIDTFYYEVV